MSAGGSGRPWLLTAALGVAAAAATWGLHGSLGDLGSAWPAGWLALAAGFTAAEAVVVHLTVGRQAHSFALAEIPLIVGLFLCSPFDLLTARLFGTLVALAICRRQPPVKVAFNLAQLWLGTVTAVWVWQAIGGRGAAPLRASLGALAATLTVAAVSLLALNAVLVLVRVAPRLGASLRVGGLALITAVANASLAVVGIDVARVNPRELWAVAVVAGFLAVAQRSHVRLQKRHDSLQRLNRFSRDLGRDLQADSVVSDILVGAVSTLDGVSAQLELTDGAGRSPMLLGYDGTKVAPLPVTARWAGELATPRRRWSSGRRRTDVVSAPLTERARPVGRLTVAGKPAAGAFGADEEDLLNAVAQQASVALANGRLADQLREQLAENEHRATHDALTGLANRLMFERHVAACLRDRRPAAVLLLDLDRFKDVNDALGHAAGDAVLRDAGDRLRAALPEAGCIARLSGDEFAVLLPTDDESAAVAAAERARRTLLQPLDVLSVPVSVDASVGVAVAPQHGDTPDVLLRHADVAMYAAKESRGAVEVYRAGIDHNDALRLSLVTDLREAVDRGRLTVVYQPKVPLGGTDEYAVEALVRWRHPDLGPLSPDAFIPIAEQTGIIRGLTDLVLAIALGQCRTWLDAGLDLAVAVNVSPRVLRDETFPDRLAALLAEHDVPPSRLILEITENAVMTDIAHAAQVLQALRDAGVRLAVDDLGVGHSSLAYLKRLPVHEVKIDKSFVLSMADDPADDAVVCAIVGLAHRLGLTVVAEGVETEPTRDRLAAIGCDVAQGYFYSRPLPAAEVQPWFTAHTDAVHRSRRLRLAT